MANRQETYKVEYLSRGDAELTKWPPETIQETQEDPEPEKFPVNEISLIEKNRGKAGALNVYLDLLKLRATKWAAERGVQTPVQTFAGIIDARHMLAEPHIFWNEALPFMARNEVGRNVKDYGKYGCILVQYPQYFTNVTRDDFLDNKNSAYYTIWQTLRDHSKTITSSGTNAIWDCTYPEFKIATSSRIEDTGTSQQFIHKFSLVHLPCFVAYGVAKETEDYIEAVYRWSTGAVELFWATVFSYQFIDYLIILTMCIAYGLACGWEKTYGYFIWVAFLAIVAAGAYIEKSEGSRPFRQLNASATIVMNTTYWFSNLSSPVWMVLVPLRIAFFRDAPLSTSLERSLSWAFIALVLRLPVAIITDRVVNMCRFLSPKTVTDRWDYSMVMWRSSQLFSVSWAYTLLSVVSGTYTAFKAGFFDTDNTMWNSFRVTDKALMDARKRIRMAYCCSCEFIFAVCNYYGLIIYGTLDAFRQPDFVTKWLAIAFFFVQLICMIISIYITNKDDADYVVATIMVCGLNMLLCLEITMLLSPTLAIFAFIIRRPEYLFAALSTVILVIEFGFGSIDILVMVKGG